MRIKVKQEHIDKGLRGSYFSCPLALASQDAGLELPGAGMHKIMYLVDDELCGSLMPDEARKFRSRFDRGWKVEPFSFDLEIGGCNG